MGPTGSKSWRQNTRSHERGSKSWRQDRGSRALGQQVMAARHRAMCPWQQVMAARHRAWCPGRQVVAARHRATCPRQQVTGPCALGGKSQGYVPWAASHRIMGLADHKLWWQDHTPGAVSLGRQPHRFMSLAGSKLG